MVQGELTQIYIVPVFKIVNLVLKSKYTYETQSNLYTSRSCKISNYVKCSSMQGMEQDKTKI